MPRRILSLVIKLFLASLAVGAAMSFFDVTPQSVFEFAGQEAQDAAEIGVDFVGWAWPYVALGAGVVIPLWLIKLLWDRMRSGGVRFRK